MLAADHLGHLFVAQADEAHPLGQHRLGADEKNVDGLFGEHLLQGQAVALHELDLHPWILRFKRGQDTGQPGMAAGGGHAQNEPVPFGGGNLGHFLIQPPLHRQNLPHTGQISLPGIGQPNGRA